MKQIVIYNFHYADIIAVPDRIAENPRYFQRKFDQWIYDKSIDHKYWVYKNGEKYGVEMGSEPFVEYLNEFHIRKYEKKAYILKTNLLDYDKDLPLLYF